MQLPRASTKAKGRLLLLVCEVYLFCPLSCVVAQHAPQWLVRARSRRHACNYLEVPSPVKINRIPTFVLQNPAARAGPRLTYTKPETVRRDGSNEVAWAFNESLLALLFTHHRFLLNRSIVAGRARARGRFANLHCSLAWFRCC